MYVFNKNHLEEMYVSCYNMLKGGTLRCILREKHMINY